MFLIRRRDPGLLNTLLGQMHNKQYVQLDYGVRGPTHARYTRLPKPSTLEAHLSLFHYAQS